MLLETVPTDTVKFTLTVEDLKSAAEIPSASPGGVYYDLLFSYGGQSFYVAATRDALDAKAFSLGVFGTAGRVKVATLEGAFDEVANTVTVTLTPADITEAQAAVATYNANPANAATKIGDIAPLAAGASFSALGVTARRNLVRAVPDIDSASSTCAFVLGAQGPVVPEVPFPALMLLSAAAVTAAVVAGRRRRAAA
jgi:hypothetical protein